MWLAEKQFQNETQIDVCRRSQCESERTRDRCVGGVGWWIRRGRYYIYIYIYIFDTRIEREEGTCKTMGDITEKDRRKSLLSRRWE